ncbi:MAG: hypothetical protein HYZ53_28175 [Planctomycetes bacterium]|nr:hypothetical protein [Planctomycetota bacterium]
MPAPTATRAPFVEITSPAPGASLSSPLVVLTARYERVRARFGTLRIGEARYPVELAGRSGVLRRNVTLLEGANRIALELGGARHEFEVVVPPSARVTLDPVPESAWTGGEPGYGGRIWGRRFRRLSGAYQECSCPAGVISVNGLLQQFSVTERTGKFAEAVLLCPGINHLAVQLGECYATRLVRARVAPARILATLLWEGPATPELRVDEPGADLERGAARGRRYDGASGLAVRTYRRMTGMGNGIRGAYVIHVRRPRVAGRLEWSLRVVTDEAGPRQRERMYYGLFDEAAPPPAPPPPTAGAVAAAPDLAASPAPGHELKVCEVVIGKGGAVTIAP